jgi:hypothetical protein
MLSPLQIVAWRQKHYIIPIYDSMSQFVVPAITLTDTGRLKMLFPFMHVRASNASPGATNFGGDL